MLGVNQLDFINYANALKGNYRKGVHKMEAIMASPTHAKEFASNLGGVSVVLSVPIGKEDRNSAQLLDLLLNSDVADDAVYTWLGQFYEFSSWDDLLGDESRCNEIMNDPLKSRAVSGSGVAVGKMVATIAGLSCSAYADMTAVAASSTAMAAIEKSQTAKGAIAASDMATAKYAAGAAGLNPADYANMAAIASSSTAMTAVAASSTAMAAIFRSDAALQAIAKSATAQAAVSNASSSVMAKTVAILANLDPNSYADMTAIASSSTAMTAVAASSTAMTAIASAASALNAVLKNGTARTKFAGSSYLQSNFDKMLSSVGNTTYFSKKFDYIDSGTKRAVSGGSTDTTATANQSIFLCKKIGAWSNGTQVTGTVTHLQTGNTAGSTSTNKGDGYNTDDYTTGGVQAKFVCIGGCTFAESGDAYCCGIFAYAK